MQIQDNVHTIEGELLKALTAAGVISEDNSSDLKKVGFNRCARTDKGVHALSQLVSFKMLMKSEDKAQVIDDINKELPEQIRVLDYVRVTKHFNAKPMCDGRIYEYVMPTFVFSPISAEQKAQLDEELTEEQMKYLRDTFSAFQSRVPKIEDNSKDAEDDEDAEQDGDQEEGQDLSMPNTARECPMSKEELNYRISDDELKRLNLILQEFVGNHNYHNYTVGRSCWDRSSIRLIRSFCHEAPFVRGGREWISLRIKGQSFMLHQIRKMVGMIILLMRVGLDASFVKKTFENVRLNIPKAPALGLFLVQPLFDSYNDRINSLTKTQDHLKSEKIDFSLYQKHIDEFRSNWIHKTIFDTELESNQFKSWLSCVFAHTYEFAYLRNSGDIPQLFYDMAKEGTYHPSRVLKKTAIPSKKRRIEATREKQEKKRLAAENTEKKTQ
ncbi:hypothetical protein MP638_005996 [Amoeboaphelidium occidentale]|nr:hypothetical protein MP638_005996 [Amoeboaphelidium occidentale]